MRNEDLTGSARRAGDLFIIPHSGKVTPTGQVIETGSPSCIVFAD